MTGDKTADPRHWRQETESDGIAWWRIDKADARWATQHPQGDIGGQQ